MLNLFDILGPVMVGPSSSHTAGAVRIGLMARTLLGEPPAEAAVMAAEPMPASLEKMPRATPQRRAVPAAPPATAAGERA